MMVTLTAIFTLAFSTATFANKEPQDSNAAQLHFVGKVENLPVFRLVLNNSVSEEYVVTVKELNGDVLFSEKLKKGTSSRVYKLDTENADLITGTTFEVTNKTTNKTTVYKISSVSRTVENVTIAKL